MAKKPEEITTKELIDKALVKMMLEFPVFGDLIIKIGVKVVNNPALRACAYTNGTAIYINECIVDELRLGNPDKPNNRVVKFTRDEMIFTLSHELMHLLNSTFDRGEDMGILKDDLSQDGQDKFKLWNAATDYEINSLLINNRSNGKSMSVGTQLAGTLYDVNYIDWPAEKIYDTLMKEAKTNGKSGAGLNFTFDNTEDSEGNGISLDAHIPILDDATRQEVASKIQDALANKQDGRTGCSAIDRCFGNIFKKQPFNWRRALTKYIRGYIKENYTWNKPSRSGQALGLILPSGSKTPKMHIGVAIDTSGSIGDKELDSMLSHVFSILTSFKNYEVDVWSCGTQVFPETLKTFTPRNRYDIAKFETKSDGCNDMEKNIEFVNERYRINKLDALIIISDFYDKMDGDEECPQCNCPVVCMCVDHEDFKKPSRLNAVVFHYEAEKKN